MAGTGVKPQYYGLTSATAGTDVATVVGPIRNNDVFTVGYTGIAPVVGVKTYETDATGLLVDGGATSGKIEILTVDTTETECTVKYND